MSVDSRHVRRESTTRVKYGLQYRDLEAIRRNDPPPEMGMHAVAWCGVDCSGEWFFGDASHVIEALAHETAITPCLACLTALRTILDTEIER